MGVKDTNLNKAKFNCAILREVDLRGISLLSLEMRGADVTGAKMTERQKVHLRSKGIDDKEGCRVKEVETAVDLSGAF